MPPIQEFINLVADESNMFSDSAPVNEIIRQYYELWKTGKDSIFISLCVETIYAEL